MLLKCVEQVASCLVSSNSDISQTKMRHHLLSVERIKRVFMRSLATLVTSVGTYVDRLQTYFTVISAALPTFDTSLR